jgi:hypothetical protein
MESGVWPVWPNAAPRWPLPEAAAAAEPAETTAAGEARPLDDVMLAMDVVDTLRHSRRLVDKELASEEDDARLLRRLHDTYASQGIEVPDEILRQGVAALKEKRFVYTPPPSGFWTFLARLYVTRKRWRADLFVYAILIALVWQWDSFGIWTRVRSLIDWPATESTQAVETIRSVETKGPIEVEKPSGPVQAQVDELTAVLQLIYALGANDAAMTRARTIYEWGKRAAEAGERHRAWDARDELKLLYDELASTYEIRIVSHPDEPSGVWRVPEANPNVRNHYLIVEAIDERGDQRSVDLPMSGSSLIMLVTQWGVRVSEETFERVKADKLDDGIIQNATLAVKRAGRLEPDYLIPVLGGTITEW